METKEKVFFTGYSKLAKRPGDLYVKRNNNCWHINAGVNSMGHDPGFGVTFDIVDGTPESKKFEEFFKKTTEIQKFLVNELGETQQSCNKVFEEIWNYIQPKNT